MLSKIVKKYKIILNGVAVGVSIFKEPDKYVKTYVLNLPEIGSATLAFLEEIRDKLISTIPIKMENLRDPVSFGKVKKQILEKANELIKEGLPEISEESVRYTSLFLANEMIGLGNIEFLLNDPNLEEIVINNSRESVWVYHKEEGWLETNVFVGNEEQIKNYASIIGRRVGKQITTLEPLMDAHLITGDRANATIFPISTKGNTLTIRKFRRKPWTITDFIENKTINYETAALVWLCVQYELSLIIGGGTASGKCVSGNTPIVLSNGSRIKIRDLYKKALKDTSKKINDGWIRALPDVKIPTLDTDDLRIENRDIEYVWKRKAPSYLYKVSTNSGQIEVTGEHPFFILKGGKLTTIRADEIKTGDFIATPRNLSINPNNPSLKDVALKNLSVAYVDTNSPHIQEVIKSKNAINIIKNLGIPRATFMAWYYGRNKIPLKILRKISNKLDVNTLYTANGKAIKVPKISPELIELYGYLVGDGHLTKTSVSFFNSNKKLRNRFKKLMKKVFGADAITEFPKGRVAKVVVYNSVLSEFFNKVLEVPYGNKARDVDLASWMFNLDNNYISSFLRAIFDCESSVNMDAEIELTSASKNLINSIIFLLRRFGIVCSYDDRKFSYRLRFADKINLSKFNSTIGFNHPDKRRKLNNVIEGKYHSNIDVVPNVAGLFSSVKNGLKMSDRFIAAKGGLTRRGFGRIRSGERNPTHFTFSRLTNSLTKMYEEQDFRSQALSFMKTLANSDVFWAKVKSVERFRYKEKWVYDVTVNDTHNFVAGENGGFIIHNTSFLNTILPFVPPNQRIISIEETRELNLPKFLHWVPLTTRESNPEGKGEVNMLDLLINSLRMRPDRIVVGEVRRQPEAEVLFEALNTGHSVYSTLHANTAEEAFRRLTSPPINLPKDLIKSLPLFAIMFRQRKKNIRRLFELTEVDSKDAKLNELYKWNPKQDKQIKIKDSKRLVSDLAMFTGMTKEGMDKDVQEKIGILKWMVKNKVNTINTVGKTISEYYSNKKEFLKNVKSPHGTKAILGDFYSELEG